MKVTALIGTLTVLALAAATNVKADDWEFQVTPYL